jgi:hypothetical protein
LGSIAGSLSPVPPSAKLQAQPKPVAVDLATKERSVEQFAGNQDQPARNQDQITQAFAMLPAAVQDINQNTLALAPLAPKAALVPLPKPKPALVPLPQSKAAYVPPPKPPRSTDVVISDFGWSERFGRASLDSDTKTLVGGAVR